MAERVKRPCLDCAVPAFGPRCPMHQAAQRAKYGPQHRAERAAWVPKVDAGLVECWRCGKPIVPTSAVGAGWDLGHRPQGDRWPEHAGPCNRSAAASGDHASVGA